MVMFKSTKKIAELENKLKELETTLENKLKELETTNKQLNKQVIDLTNAIEKYMKESEKHIKEIELTISNIVDDGTRKSTAEELITEWFLGAQDGEK